MDFWWSGILWRWISIVSSSPLPAPVVLSPWCLIDLLSLIFFWKFMFSDSWFYPFIRMIEESMSHLELQPNPTWSTSIEGGISATLFLLNWKLFPPVQFLDSWKRTSSNPIFPRFLFMSPSHSRKFLPPSVSSLFQNAHFPSHSLENTHPIQLLWSPYDPTPT